MTFQNTDIAILAGTKGLAGAKGLTVNHSIFKNIAAGVWRFHLPFSSLPSR
ncbi:MAG: hypothetical protein ACLQDQ_14610 [Myxococcaceae bacterium]